MLKFIVLIKNVFDIAGNLKYKQHQLEQIKIYLFQVPTAASGTSAENLESLQHEPDGSVIVPAVNLPTVFNIEPAPVTH